MQDIAETEHEVAIAGQSVDLAADFDELLDQAIPRGYVPVAIRGLARFSTKKQKKGSSESRQLGRILAICKRYGWPAPTWILDRGVSGYRKSKDGVTMNLHPTKAALGRFIHEAGQGKIPNGTLLICDNPDRFSRAALDAADTALMTLLRNGVAVLFLSMQMLLKPGDKDNNQKRQAVMNELTRANREAATKSKYIRDSFAIRLEKAKSGEQRNFGGQVPRWLKWDKNAKKYVPHPEKWGTVQRIVSEVIAQKMWGHIVRDLNAAKVPCLLGGKRWQHANVYQLVRNPALRGDFHGLVGYVPAVVNPAQWDLLQARLAVSNKRGGGSRNSDKIRNLFPALVRCSRCGMPMRVIKGGSGGTLHDQSYVCMGQVTGVAAKPELPVCDETRVIKVRAIELDFFGLMLTKLPSTLLLQRDEARQAEIAAVHAEIAVHTGTITRLGRLFAATGIETPELVNDIKAARDRVAALQKQECELLKEARVDIGADAAWQDVMKLLKSHLPTEATEAARDTLLDAAAKLRVQLADNELRKKLIAPLKMLVSSVEIDVKGKEKKYRVELLGGGYTEWRDVSELNAQLISLNVAAGFSDRVRALLSAKARARAGKYHMTAEHRAAISRARRGSTSAETRALLSRLAKERWAKRRATLAVAA